MSNLAKKTDMISADIIEQVMIRGDLSGLNPKQRVEYYGAVCKSVGLNPLTKPFEYITLNNKQVLYALRAATDQLRSVHKISVTITNREKIDDVYIVTARAKNSDGREDESAGAVNVTGLKGEAMANAYMKAETKAKRRVTLSICGLGLLDESEVETIPDAKTVSPQKDVLKEMREEREVVEADSGEFTANFGKYNGQKLKNIDVYDLAGYVHFIESKAQQEGKQIIGKVAEFIKHATAWCDLKIEQPPALDADEKLFED